MARLIQKAGYIKGGKGGGKYMRYIATREGVELIEGTGDPTPKQKELVQMILKDFPDTKNLFEYRDFRDKPSVRSASAFIGAALDYNAEAAQAQDIYMQYIATRPPAWRKTRMDSTVSSVPPSMWIWTQPCSFLITRREMCGRLSIPCAVRMRNVSATTVRSGGSTSCPNTRRTSPTPWESP